MREIKALTSLRGIAAMMVVLQHFSATVQLQAAGSIPSLVPHGYMAVNLFFVLSGFIMAYTYSGDFDRRGLQAMPSFLLKRAARILPLNTAVVLAIVLAGFGSKAVWGNNIFHASNALSYDVICNLFLLQAFGLGTNLNGPSWSICTEFAAYLAFPVLLASVFSRRTMVAFAALSASEAALVVTALNHPRLGLDVGAISGELTLCLSQFLLGIFTYRMTQSRRLSVILRKDWPAVLIAGWIGACLLLRLDLPAAIAFPPLVAALACNSGRIARLMSTRVPYFFGEISFSIYLIHDPCRRLALIAIRTIHPGLLDMSAALTCALVASLLVVPLAWVAYIVIERPGRRIVRGFRSMVVQTVIS